MRPRLRFAAAFSLAIVGALTVSALGPRAQPATDWAKQPRRQQCFYASNISNYTTEGDRIVYLRVGVNDIYRLDLMTDCPELSFRQNIEFSRVDRGASICSAIDLMIKFRENGARRICPVGEMRLLTPTEISALPKRVLP